jgi:hypothetical protein
MGSSTFVEGFPYWWVRLMSNRRWRKEDRRLCLKLRNGQADPDALTFSRTTGRAPVEWYW